jgi:RNA polymerase sigma-70 factor (ECF subfamily)
VRRRERYETFDDECSTTELADLRATAVNPERQAFAGELRGLLEWAVDALPNGMREAFVLRDVEGLSTLEVAQILEITEDAVKTRLSRARSALRRLLSERTGAVAAEAFRFHRPRCDRLVSLVLEQITAFRA